MADSPPPTVEQLKPCPFCGEKPTAFEPHPSRHNLWVISCEESDCRVVSEVDGGSLAEAAASWNTRFDTARTAELERENAALDGALWDVIKAWDNASGMSAAIARARNALGGQP